MLAALALAFVVALLYGRLVPSGIRDTVDRLLAFMMGVYQRGVGMGWESAYSLWPLLGSMVVVSLLCGTASWLLIRRREVRPGIEAMA